MNKFSVYPASHDKHFEVDLVVPAGHVLELVRGTVVETLDSVEVILPAHFIISVSGSYPIGQVS